MYFWRLKKCEGLQKVNVYYLIAIEHKIRCKQFKLAASLIRSTNPSRLVSKSFIFKQIFDRVSLTIE